MSLHFVTDSIKLEQAVAIALAYKIGTQNRIAASAQVINAQFDEFLGGLWKVSLVSSFCLNAPSKRGIDRRLYHRFGHWRLERGKQ
jgi:hypothetical protein